jgi:hypothetical protein
MRTQLLILAASAIAASAPGAGCTGTSAEPNDRPSAAGTARPETTTRQKIETELARECVDGDRATQSLQLAPKDTAQIEAVVERLAAPSLIDSLKQFYRYSYRQARAEIASYPAGEQSRWDPNQIEGIDESTYVAIYMSRYEQRESARLRQIALERQHNQQTNPHP